MLDAPSASCALVSSISASRSHLAACRARIAVSIARTSSPVEEATDRIARAASRIVAMVVSSPPSMLQTYQNRCSTASAFPQFSGGFRRALDSPVGAKCRSRRTALHASPILSADLEERLGHLLQRADPCGLHQHPEDVLTGC